MKTTLLFASIFIASASVIGCGSSDDTAPATPADTGTTVGDTGTGDSTPPGDTGTADSGTGDTPTDSPVTPPAPPALGAQIDRMGRPAVNTALNNSFNPTDATKGAAKDEYNQNDKPATWVKYVPEFEKNLAIFDALDTKCGNQLAADPAKTDKTRYQTLAGALADDRLWLNSAATDCTTYLAVEANALKVVTNSDCGGRKPSYDPIKETYSIVAAGALSGVTDGTTTPDRAKSVTFPYLVAPH